MDRLPVQSTAIRSIGYDAETGSLDIEFHHGRVYRYRGVPEFLHQGLMLAKSKGLFFNIRIADRYPLEQIG